MTASRRGMFKFAGAALATASMVSPRILLAQVQEEAENESVTLVRKGIDKKTSTIVSKASDSRHEAKD